ncbi:MAG: hypothetical protein DMG08_19255 [Acidobacteria bacterium]|nr:MAG: hypothetical protein DMG08_19255 [Acidobacteriota bacterium]
MVGSTTPTASDPKDDPVSVEDLAFTVYKVLGIDPNKEFHANGRPIKIANNGKLIGALFT